MSKQRCQVYLTIDVSTSSGARLAAALDAAQIAAVMFAPLPDQSLDAATVKPLLTLVQAKGIAALIHGDATLARTLGADGVHLPPSLHLAADYAKARAIVGASVMVGADAGSSRHDAMELAEAGADYIALSVIDPGGGRYDHEMSDDDVPDDATLGEAALKVDRAADAPEPDDDDDDDDQIDDFAGIDLISWWVDVFQTPCVALGVTTADVAAEVASEGCEFINITLQPGLSPTATADFVRVIVNATA